MGYEISTWLIPLLTEESLEFSYNGLQQIHIVGVRVGDHLEVSARVHVPGHFTWGFNRFRTDKSFSACVKEVVLKTLSQMYAEGVNAGEMLKDIRLIWKSNE